MTDQSLGKYRRFMPQVLAIAQMSAYIAEFDAIGG